MKDFTGACLDRNWIITIYKIIIIKIINYNNQSVWIDGVW